MRRPAGSRPWELPSAGTQPNRCACVCVLAHIKTCVDSACSAARAVSGQEPLMRFALASGGARAQGPRGRRRQRARRKSDQDGAAGFFSASPGDAAADGLWRHWVLFHPHVGSSRQRNGLVLRMGCAAGADPFAFIAPKPKPRAALECADCVLLQAWRGHECGVQADGESRD